MRNEIRDETQNGTASLGERIGRRRVRRWSRRARIAAPFLAVPAMLGLLILSVGLIEYQPQKKKARVPNELPASVATRDSIARPQAILAKAQSVSSLSVIEPQLASPSRSPSASGMEATKGTEVEPSAAAALIARPGTAR